MSRSRARRTRPGSHEVNEDGQPAVPEGTRAPDRARGGAGSGSPSVGGSDVDRALGNAALGSLIAPKAAARNAGAAGGGGDPALHEVLGQRDVGNAAAGRAVAQRSPKAGAGPRPDAAGDVDSVLRSPGEQLPTDVARTMEPLVGGSLERVRIHRDAAAARSADALDANAYTVGGHVVFGPERYDPGSSSGRSSSRTS